MRHMSPTHKNGFNAYSVQNYGKNWDRFGRVVFDAVLWLAAAFVFVTILIAIGVGLDHVGAKGKVAEFWLGLAFLPAYFSVRHVWMTLRRFLNPLSS